MIKKAFFITFEGGEGSGKSIQMKKVADHLISQGFRVISSREPGGLEISEEIREVLLKPRSNDIPKMSGETELLLFMAARAHYYENVVIPSLEKYDFILSDRSGDSTKAYQGYGRGLDLKLIDDLNIKFTYGISPDLTFVIDLDPKIGLERVTVNRGHKKDRLDQEELNFYQRIRNGYLAMARQEPKRFVVLKGENSIDQITEDILNTIKEKFITV